MESREEMFKRQEIIAEAIRKLAINFGKDSKTRKTTDYLEHRLTTLNTLWDEFEVNHVVLNRPENQTHDYFTSNAYVLLQGEYIALQNKLKNFAPADGDKSETGVLSKSDELKNQQGTNFRAFSRCVRNLDVQNINDKWEIEDKIKTLQSRWNAIDEVHWKLDNLLAGTDVEHEVEFTKYEKIYEATKKELNNKLSSVVQRCESSPKIEIPVFSGNYNQWPTFLDLYTEAIHKNNAISKAQKMQHLKGKLRGEAERLVQHLTISADNYDSCWEILNHRYNNTQLLFTKQMQTFMSQPTVQHQNAYDLRRLHDTSFETIHAIHNLRIDTTSWDPILVHIITGKLDTQTYSDYMEARKSPRDLPSFDELMNFIEGKFTALDQVGKKKQFSPPAKQTNSKDSPSTTARDSYNKNKRNSAKTFHASTEKNCPICTTNHVLFQCKSFQDMTPENKMRSIEQFDICKNCMYSHNGNKCNSRKTCRVCNKPHHTILHDVLRDSEPTTSTVQRPKVVATPKSPNSQHTANHVAGDFNEVLLATVQLYVKAADGTNISMRCLLDQGSQINLITESAAQRLGLQRRKQNATVSGIGITSKQSNGTVKLECESLYGYQFTTEALVMAKMINRLPNYSFEKQNWPHVHNINLADPEYNISKPVDILLDAGVYAEIIMSGILRGVNHAPIAQQTKVGWVLLGNIKTFNCHALLNDTDDLARFWEIEEITDSINSSSAEDNYCETLYANTTRRLNDGRYEVKIPMKPDFERNLGTSKPQAVAQFIQLEKRLAKDQHFALSYKSFIDEYLELNHMKHCTTRKEPYCFPPHHGVLRPESTTTKLRVVFNASARTSTGCSLNQLMECGPNLQQDLQAMILRWRGFEYVYTADIEKFYRQIRIQEEDQHLQKIVWRDSPSDVIKEFQLSTVTYGTKSAPFLAMRTIKQLIKDDGSQYPLAAKILDSQLYVDDLLAGSNNFMEAQAAQNELIDMLKGGGFNLRKWASNHPSLLQSLHQDLISQKMFNFKDAETNKTLGITWNPRTDQFTFQQTPLSNKRDVITKRDLLSDLSKLYDPLGWLSPATMKAKLLFQQAWTTTSTWDDPLPDKIQQDWEQYRLELPSFHEITIPRWIGDTQAPIELHGFCDASERAYGCVIYCKSWGSDGQPVIKLVAGKTKLAPLKKPTTLPRLELCGALLLSRLMKKVIESTNSQTVTLFGWTDSMVVLGWLQGEVNRWKAFVANRVTQITSVMPSTTWKHVKSEDNAADCASRGLSPAQLLVHPLWWEGPSWLNGKILLHQETFSTTEEQKRQKQVNVTQTKAQLVMDLLQKYSSMTNVIRVLSWVMRFVHNTRDVKQAKRTSFLTTADIEASYNAIIKIVQTTIFKEEILQLRKQNAVRSTSSILNLNPFLDKNDILRVGGRLEQSNLHQLTKHPIILPRKHKLTELLIDQAHKTTLHGGARLTLAHLRNRYWILGGMKTVKSQLTKCVRCHRFKPQQNSQLMADLPKPRVSPSRPFTHTGVDFTGQVEVKVNKGRGIRTTKAYVAIFICMSTKAIHLELVSDLSTAAFLAALKRLCGRRGTPRHIYSDNGTNFVGAARVLTKERKEALQLLIDNDLINNITEWGIEWHFNAPAWPTAGGLWEAAVKSMKHHLKRVLGEQKLTFEEFSTLLTQIEACLNSRPLLAITNDTDDLDCLTPGHFLVGGPVLAPPLASDGDNRSLTLRWQLTENMHRDFWKKWSRDYLQTLQSRGKWRYPTANLKIDDIVLVKEDHIPPARWLLGRVTETHAGADGRVRVVTLKTKTNCMKRPITKLSRLPTEDETSTSETSMTKEPDQRQTDTISSKPQRQLRPRPIKRTAFTACLSTLMYLLVVCITPSTQQLTNVTAFEQTRLVHFDKIADMQIVQDEWKMIVYYNLSTYWKSVENIEGYVHHLQAVCKQQSAYIAIASQFEHELQELKHYNDVLRSEHGKRMKRGLINGVGYVANTLFGVLDDSFANKYNNDIKLLQDNQNHLITLYKQHTSIIEGEYNLLKRNEQVMNQQLIIINRHMRETQAQLRADLQNSAYITATALAANMILSNLRNIQQSLLDLVTDVRNGKIDIHLLKPDAFEQQLNVISGQVPKGTSLPCTSSYGCIRQMYKLSRVHVKLTEDVLMFEVKIPLVADEQYELTRALPIRNVKGNTMTSVKLTSGYLAINLRKDMLIPLSLQDTSSCVHLHEHQLICHLDLPIYDIKTTDSFCEAQIINDRPASSCHIEVSTCKDDWIKLHSRGAWLFTCCEECTARIFCPAGVTSQTLRNTGIITLSEGCMLRGKHHLIYSHNKLQSEMKIEEEEMYIPQSGVNELIVIKGNITQDENLDLEAHEEQLRSLKHKIETIKDQQQFFTRMSADGRTHHYIMYGFIAICLILLGIWSGVKLRKRFMRPNRSRVEEPTDDISMTQIRAPEEQTRPRLTSRCTDAAGEIVVHTCMVDNSTSPTPRGSK